MEGEGQPETGQELAALERFVVDNDDLLALESLIGRFNIFDALDIARVEIRHSNFLAFILDPSESHGQGQLFLRSLLMDLLKAAPVDLRPLSPIELDGIDLRGVDVRREWGHIDLLITCQQPRFAVVIENKVGAEEHSNQLARYMSTMKEHYPDIPPLYVFLTASGSEPSHEKWVQYSYADLHRVLARVRETYRNSIGEDVLVFLDHYLTLIGTRFMNNEKIDELCQRIYKNHRQAVELIYARVGNPASGIVGDVETVLREDPRWHVFRRSPSYIDFGCTAWLQWMPPLGLDYKDEPCAWLTLRFELYTGKLDFYVQVNRMPDVAKRRQIVDLLLAEGARFGFKRKGAREVKDNYTRVSSRERVIVWTEDEEPEEETVREAVRKKLDDIFPKLDGLPTLLKKVLGIAE